MCSLSSAATSVGTAVLPIFARARAVPEGASFFLQFAAQFRVVVDLTVEYDLQRAVLVGDRLAAVLDVDDRQPPHRQAGVRRDEVPLVVRPAVYERAIHPLEYAADFIRSDFPGRDESANAAHCVIGTGGRDPDEAAPGIIKLEHVVSQNR